MNTTNAEEFYEAFKDALKFLNCDWRDKASIKVVMFNEQFIMTDGRRSVVLVGKKMEEPHNADS